MELYLRERSGRPHSKSFFSNAASVEVPSKVGWDERQRPTGEVPLEPMDCFENGLTILSSRDQLQRRISRFPKPTSERTYEAIMVGFWNCHGRNVNRSCKIHTTSMLCHKY